MGTGNSHILREHILNLRLCVVWLLTVFLQQGCLDGGGGAMRGVGSAIFPEDSLLTRAPLGLITNKLLSGPVVFFIFCLPFDDFLVLSDVVNWRLLMDVVIWRSFSSLLAVLETKAAGHFIFDFVP